jgi:3-oxoacyl-[acyl-carrier protein] reductase
MAEGTGMQVRIVTSDRDAYQLLDDHVKVISNDFKLIGPAEVLEKYGVTANAIMPRARTRMNDSGTLAEMFAKPAQGFDVYAPENVSPLVTFLASPAAERVSGYVLVVYGKQITLVSAPRLEPVFENEGPWTYDGVVEKLGPWFDAHSPVIDGFTVPAT